MKQFMFKQDLAQVYFEGYDQEVARRLLAREIHGNAELWPSWKPLATVVHRSGFRPNR